MSNFAITGVAGYIAPRHLKAIKETGNTLVAAVDPHDSVGVLDSYFPDAAFFTEFERFDRHLEKLRRGPGSERVQYVSICSPNHLHDAHIRQALRVGAHAICEKPLVLNPWNLDALRDLEAEYERRVYVILQLRLHPAAIALKQTVEQAGGTRRHTVDLRYIAPRGRWYGYSWKGDKEKSGGIASNIGIHFFDLLLWIFGDVRAVDVEIRERQKMVGRLQLEHADVSWFLSTNPADMPGEAQGRGYRALTVDGAAYDLAGGFEHLHTDVYHDILSGGGFGIDEAYASIALVRELR
ncbi:MAG: Gfo/Idh/MocA family oxidoreductase [Bacteroidia bacterium]|nr:Gfo/Idh/MocA family oxidoreductase [Bacteroidia bacterium]